MFVSPILRTRCEYLEQNPTTTQFSFLNRFRNYIVSVDFYDFLQQF